MYGKRMHAMMLVPVLNAARNKGISPSMATGVPSNAPRVSRVARINCGRSKGRPRTAPSAPPPAWTWEATAVTKTNVVVTQDSSSRRLEVDRKTSQSSPRNRVQPGRDQGSHKETVKCVIRNA